MNIKEKLQADLEQKIANIPVDVEHISEEAWDKVKDFFKGM